MNNDIAAVILAAGKGTRFASKDVRLPAKQVNKVTLPLAGKPIILYPVELLEDLGIAPIVIVIGFAKDSVKKVLGDKHVLFVEQKEQLGTAHAVLVALSHIPAKKQHVLVVNGDDPFHIKEVMQKLIDTHEQSRGAITFLTSKLENPSGMGRIVRSHQNQITGIVEEKDATVRERKIKEVNGACYIFTRTFLQKYLPKLEKSIVSGEYYLTDLIAVAVKNGEKVVNYESDHKWKGINTPYDLAEAENWYKQACITA